jgi:hypothetical protein
MKTLGNLCLVPLLLLLTGCHHDVGNSVSEHKYYNGHILIALRDIPVGTALNAPDFRVGYGWTPYDEGAWP